MPAAQKTNRTQDCVLHALHEEEQLPQYCRGMREQAVRSLGPLGCTCYQVSTGGLSTNWSGWDLNPFWRTDGKRHLGIGFALRCFQRLSLLSVAIQPWPGQANWLTSGSAISVLSY